MLSLGAAEDVLHGRSDTLGHSKAGHGGTAVVGSDAVALLLVVEDLAIIESHWEAETAAGPSTLGDLLNLNRVLVVAAVGVLLVDGVVVPVWVLAKSINHKAAKAVELITSVTGVVSVRWSLYNC